MDAALSELGASPKSAEAHALLCGLFNSIEQYDNAIAECEAAVRANPESSQYELDLARSYGAKADHGGALTGMRMIGRIRSAFEHAVELDGKNVDALSDLGQFYVEAPGVVGGGLDKARPLVDRLKPLSPARSHRLAAMIAAKDHDDATAEREYAAELAVAHSPEAYVDLATYDHNRKQYEKAAESARQAIEADRGHGSDTLDAAVLLIGMKRNVEAARAGLRAYLATPQTIAVASYARAHRLLGDSLAAAGDSAGAQKEYAAALALAHDYQPARKALNS